jgi:hypothetical protein
MPIADITASGAWRLFPRKVQPTLDWHIGYVRTVWGFCREFFQPLCSLVIQFSECFFLMFRSRE